MATCPTCMERFADDTALCPRDGESLLPDEAFSSADADLAAGTMVGEYRIDRKLGAGGFGTVYRAVHPVIGKAAAVKVLSRQYSSSPQMVARFISEARAANRIRHKNIVDVFSFGTLENDGRQYLVMELLEGSTLDAYIKKREALAPEMMIPIFRAIARALDAAHAAGVAHRDLKPENVFLISDEDAGIVPKLLDFGIAKLLTDATSGPKTRTGTPMGTPEYMSPEQCRGKNVDHRTDVYSFGIMAHEALTGRRPFAGDVMDLLMHHVHSTPPTASSMRPGLAPELDAPILAMLEKDPDKRPASVGAALAALEQAAVRAGLAIKPAAAPASGEGGELDHASGLGDAETLSPEQAQALGLAATRTPEPSGPRTIAGATADPRAPAPRKNGFLLVAGGLAVGGIVTAALFYGGRGSSSAVVAESPPSSGNAVVLASATPPPPPPVPPAGAAPAVSAAEIELTVHSKPEHAEIWSGSEKLGTAPGPLRMPQSDQPTKLTVKAPGYAPSEVTVVPTASASVSVALTKPKGTAPKTHSELEF